MEANNVRSREEEDKNKTCDSCGKAFYAYEIPGREVYKCNDCKLE